jgi:hypothetical protein
MDDDQLRQRSHYIPQQAFEHRDRRLALGRSLFQWDKRKIYLVIQLRSFQEERVATIGGIAILWILQSQCNYRN